MADFLGTTDVSVPADALFDYLSEVSNLPKYFARMTSAEPGQGEEVKTTAKMPDGTEVQGDAWFKVDEAAKKLHWGSEGPSEYEGELEVTGEGGSSTVEVRLRTTRVEPADAGVKDGITETLANIKRLVESD